MKLEQPSNQLKTEGNSLVSDEYTCNYTGTTATLESNPEVIKWEIHVKEESTKSTVVDLDPNVPVPTEKHVEYHNFNYPSIKKQRRTKGQLHCCGQCNEEFRTFGGLKVHSIKHDIPKSEQTYPCDKEKTSKKKGYQCDKCRKKFHSATELNNHNRTHERDTSNVSVKVLSKQNISVRVTEGKGLEGLVDENVSLTTGVGRKNNRRRRKHNTHEIKRYLCDVCGKNICSYSFQSPLRRHTNERPFSCRVCGKGWTSKVRLKRHMRSHSNVRPHVCEVCGLAFKLNNALKLHMMRHTGERPFKCMTCGKGFIQSQALQSHIRTHTGVKPYKCKECGKEYTGSCHLKIHMRVHTGEKPFKCKVCEKAFAHQWPSDRTYQNTHRGKAIQM